MTKKVINQNANYDNELLNSIEPNFIFEEKPVKRIKGSDASLQKVNKEKELTKLKNQINSIEDCSLKNNSKQIILGDGNINSPIMIIGEAPSDDEYKTGLTFSGEVGDLL